MFSPKKIGESASGSFSSSKDVRSVADSQKGQKLDNQFKLWRYNLRSLLCEKPQLEQSTYSNTEIMVAILSVSLFNLERNMRWAGLELSSRHYCWSDMKSRDPSSISDAVVYLLRQHLVTYVQDNVIALTDPSPAKILRAVSRLNGAEKFNRCIFLFNGHGTPEPISNDSIILQPEEGFGIAPLPIKELLDKMDVPACYIFDCDFAGSLHHVFKERGDENTFAFFACGPDETLTHRLGLPADLFTSCLLTPALISMLWGSRQFYAFKKEGLHQFPLPYFTDENGVRPHLLSFSFEIEKLLRCLVKAMAYGAMKPADLFNIFYRDAKAGKLFINFCVAKRIGSEIGFTPMCWPEIPDFSKHPLWEFFDLYLDRVLLRLTQIENSRSVTQQQIAGDMASFLLDGLSAVEHALDLKFCDTNPSEIALLPMILCEQALHKRAILALTKFIDTGDAALRAGLCYGLLPIILSMPYQNEPELLLPIGYIIAKFLCFSFKSEGQLTAFTCSGAPVIQPLFNASSSDKPEYVLVALIIMVAGLQIDGDDEAEKIGSNIFEAVLKFVSMENLLMQFWCLLFIGEYITSSPKAQLFDHPVAESIRCAKDGRLAETRCAFMEAFGTLIDYDNDRLAEHLDLWYEVLVSLENEPCHLVRMQELLLAQKVVARMLEEPENPAVKKIAEATLKRLSALADDPSPDISRYAALLQAKYTEGKLDIDNEITATLLTGAVDQFLAVKFSELSNYSIPPFCSEPTVPPSTPTPSKVGGGSAKKNTPCVGMKFTEIDHIDPGRTITTNVAFYGGERLMFADSDGTITIRNYTDHSDEISHSWDMFFSPRARKHPIQTLVPLAQDIIMCMTEDGDVSIISNVMGSSPALADSLRITPHITELEHKPTIDYDTVNALIYGSGERGIIRPFDIRCGCMLDDIKVSDDWITGIRVMKDTPSLIGVGTDDLRFVDIRDPVKPAVVASWASRPLDFKPMGWNENQIMVAYSDDTVAWLDMRNPSEQRVVMRHPDIVSIDTCCCGPYGLVAGPNVWIIDMIGGERYSVIDGMYPVRQRPNDITAATFHTSKASLGFIVQNKSIVIAGFLPEH